MQQFGTTGQLKHSPDLATARGEDTEWGREKREKGKERRKGSI